MLGASALFFIQGLFAMKRLIIAYALILSGCAGGGGESNDTSAPLLPNNVYSLDNPAPSSTNYQTITFHDDTGAQYDAEHYTSLYDYVAGCMGMSGDYPRIYVEDILTNSDGEHPLGTTVFSGSTSSMWINVNRQDVNNGVLSHEFIHYILFSNFVFNDLNLEHTSHFFDQCVISPFLVFIPEN